MSSPKSHHYIPQFYLKGFTTEGDGSLIHVFEKGKTSSFITTTKNVATETHYYSLPTGDGSLDPSFETYLAEQVEAPANPILQKIRQRQTITKDEKAVVANYISVLMKRVPRHRKRMQDLAPGVVEELSKKFDEDVAALTSSNTIPAEILERQRVAGLEYLRTLRENFPKDLMLRLINFSLADNLYAMTWRFMIYDRGPAFLTSDNPVFFFEGLGIGREESEITFPISTDIALWATWRRDIEEGYFPVPERIVKEVNRRTATLATKYIYSGFTADWIPTIINRKAHRLNRII